MQRLIEVPHTGPLHPVAELPKKERPGVVPQPEAHRLLRVGAEIALGTPLEAPSRLRGGEMLDPRREHLRDLLLPS